MPFYFKHGDHKVNLEDLPLDRWITIEAESGSSWIEVLSGKLGESRVAKSVIVQACEHLGIDVPPLTIRKLANMLVFEKEESLPTEYADGIPDPKATDSEPATT